MFTRILSIGVLALLFASCNSMKPSGTETNDPPDAPSNPTPADGAADQEININLTWSWNDVDGDTLTFNLYFGTETNPPLIESNRRQPWYDPETLLYGQTYFWKIAADDGHGNHTDGPIWSFTTRAMRSFNVLAQYIDASQGPFYDLTGNVQSYYLYVTNRHSSGARDSSLILDISNINNINVAGYIKGALFGNQYGIGYIYSVGRLDSGFKLRAYSLGDPIHPNEEFRTDVTNIMDLAVYGDYVYLYMNNHDIAGQNGTITVRNMIMLDTLTTIYTANWGRLRIYGTLLLLIQDEALQIIDIGDPGAPQILTTRSALDHCYDATISGTTMYVAQHGAGVEILDISNPAVTVPIGIIPSINNSTDLALAYQSILYVADNNLLIAYNIVNPSAPYELARYEAPAKIMSLNYLQALLITYFDLAGVSGIQGLGMQE